MRIVLVLPLFLLACITPTYKGAIVHQWKIEDYCLGLGFAGSGSKGPGKGVGATFRVFVGSTDVRQECRYPKGDSNETDYRRSEDYTRHSRWSCSVIRDTADRHKLVCNRIARPWTRGVQLVQEDEVRGFVEDPPSK